MRNSIDQRSLLALRTFFVQLLHQLLFYLHPLTLHYPCGKAHHTRRVMSIHPADLLTQSTCLVKVVALLDDVQLHQLLVALFLVLRCKLVESTIITIHIIQRNNL